jgi:hypothetical protein
MRTLVDQLSIGLLIAVSSGLLGMSALMIGYGLFGAYEDESIENISIEDTRQ